MDLSYFTSMTRESTILNHKIIDKFESDKNQETMKMVFSKEPVLRLKCIKKRTELISRSSKEILKSSLRNHDPFSNPIKTKLNNFSCTQKSPEKVPEKYKSARRLLNFCENNDLIPKKHKSHSPKPTFSIQNLYFKNQNYFYSNNSFIKIN